MVSGSRCGSIGTDSREGRAWAMGVERDAGGDAVTIATCHACGQEYFRFSGGVVCGLCCARGITGPRAPIVPVWHRVRVIAPHSSRLGQVGIGRELTTAWAVQFGDGRKCSFRKNAVKVIG